MNDKAVRGRVVNKPGNKPTEANRLMQVHLRLFRSDIEKIKVIAEERGMPWHVELRLLVRKVLKNEEILILPRESPK